MTLPEPFIYPNKWYANMTLGDAIEFLSEPSIACACCGPPWYKGKTLSPYCWCRLAYGQANALQRAAHIAVKLMLTKVEKDLGEELEE